MKLESKYLLIAAMVVMLVLSALGTQAAAADVAASRPATLPGKTKRSMTVVEPQRNIWRQTAASLAKRMKASKRAINLVLRHHPVGLRDRNAHPNLHLLWMAPAGVNLPATMIVMSRPEALAAIDALDKAGYFERAGDVTARRAMRTRTPWPEHKGPCYSLTVSSDTTDCHANLGWNLKMLEYLDALRKAFDKDSDAGKAMDKVLNALQPQRKKWQKAPAAQPGKAARRIQGVRDRIDSLELAIRYHGGEKGLYSLKLRVPKYKVAPREGWFEREINRQTATKLLDVLARNGFFTRAEDISGKGDGAPRGTYYAFWLRVYDKQRVLRYREIRGWDLEMLKCLDALRKVLDGETGMAMDKLLKRLEPHRKTWEKAAADPKFVETHAREVEREYRQYRAKRKAGLQAEYCAWLKGRQAIGPLMLPYLLASVDVGVKHHGMILARDYYGSGKIVPNTIAVLEELLKAPRDTEASTRAVACQVLGRWPDIRSLPVLLKALDDPWMRHELVGGPRGHAGHSYRTVWWEADEALRAITGASPVKKPFTHVMPRPGDRKATSAAWKKWWAENKDKLTKGPKGERVVVQLPKSGPPVLVNRGPGTIWYASSVMEMKIRYVISERAISIPSHLKDRVDPRPSELRIIRKTKRVEAGFAHTAHWTRAKKTSQWPAQLGGRVLQVKWLPLKPGGSIEAKMPFITTRQRALNTIPAPWWTPRLRTTGPVFVTARVRKDPADADSEIVVKSNSREATGPVPPLILRPTTRKAGQARAQRDVKPRQACLAALRKIRKSFAALAAKYPKELGHLGPGAIDEEKLLLRFSVKGLANTTQPARRATSAGGMRSFTRPLQPSELGLFVQFSVPMPERTMARWLYSNVGLSWRWVWSNRPFSWKAQQDFLNMLNKALAPLNELENAMVAADLPRRKTGAFVLRGRPGVKLSLRLAPKRTADGSAIIDLYATNETEKVLALCPPFPQVLGDGKGWYYRAPDALSMLIRASYGGKDPFIYIKPGQTAKIGAMVAAGFSAGRHTVRIAVRHGRGTWIDTSPMAYDGPPITHKVPAAWTGVLVSGELAIDIPAPEAANKKAAERAKLLKKNTGMLYLILQYHLGYIGAKPSLHLATGVYKIELMGGILARLTPKEAANIIDHLAKEGFLAQAENVVGKDITPPQGPAYTLTLMGAGQTQFYQVLGWDLKMLRRLDALRKALDKESDAGKAMDKLLKRLAEKHPEWKRPPGKIPSLRQVVRGGYTFIAICKALNEPQGVSATTGVQQKFKVQAFLDGTRPAGKTFDLNYQYFANTSSPERPIRKEEKVIWIVRQRADSYQGARALAYTPENHNAVGEAVLFDRYAGKAVNGLKLTLRATKPTTTMRPDGRSAEPVPLAFTFANVGDKPIKIETSDHLWSRLKLHVTGPSGKSVRITELMVERIGPIKVTFSVLKAGQSVTYSRRSGEHFGGKYESHDLLKPGAYRIWASYLSAVAVSNEITLTVKAAPATQPAEVVRRAPVAAAKVIRGFTKIDTFVRGDARIALGRTRAEIREQLSKGKVKSHKPYAFKKPQPEMFKRNVWVIFYGPEVPGMGRVDELRVSFKDDKVSKLEIRVHLCP